MIKLVSELSPKQREWRNDPRCMEGCRQNEEITEEEQRAWEEESDPTRRVFGLLAQGTIVGYAMLSHIDRRHGTAEYSLLIGPEHQGKGYAKEGLKALINYGFNDLGLHKIYGDIFIYNDASLHIAKALGFQIEGLLKEHYYKRGERVDAVVVGLLRGEWDASRI